MIYTAPYAMFLMWANPLRGQVGGGWILELRLLGPVEWHGADRWVPFGVQNSRDFQGTPPSHLPASKALRTGPYQSDVHR